MQPNQTAKNPQNYSTSESWKMFDRIAPRYDFLNRFLSFGLDVGWRKDLAKFLPQRQNLEILDLATGTADVPLYLLQRTKNIRQIYGIDMSRSMLKIGEKKIARADFSDRILLREGDINQIPFAQNRFDAVTIAFGIRNVEDPAHVLREIHRVLKPKGRALILEFSIPQVMPIKPIYLFYLQQVLPRVGTLVSGDLKAYHYLNATVRAFPFGKEFCEMMAHAGFINVKTNPLSSGIAAIYQGEKV